MRYKNGFNNIFKDKIKRKKYTKSEIKKIIYKNIINNKNVKPLLRISIIFKLNGLNLKNSISKQNNNTCLKTGRIGGVYKITSFSRHFMKKLALHNNLQNLKIQGW